MKDKRFIEALDRLNIRDSRREELLGEILLRAEAEEREKKYMKKSRRSVPLRLDFVQNAM